jgi:outer membrane protein assembly factor BamB
VALSDWPAYLVARGHWSYNAAETVIRPGNAAGLALKWHFAGDQPTMPGQPAAAFISSPIVADGAVFVGSEAGWFYKLDDGTGAVVAKVFIGFQPELTCPAMGFSATATVAADPSDGQDTVYVAAPDGYLYALRASDLSVKWRSVIAIPSARTNDYYDWSSPTVANGKIYVGIASNCDDPLIRGGVAGYDQVSGQRFAVFYSVPSGVVGGSVWSSVAVDSSGYVYATTGNPQEGLSQPYYGESIVKLSPSTLQPVAAFTVPKGQRIGDGDFGGSPTIFGPYVGACNKSGVFYAVSRSTMTEVWQQQIGAGPSPATEAQCSSEAIYDGRYLYFAGPATTINGVSFRGSIRRLDPATGSFLWQTGLPNGVIGAPSLDGAQVIAVGTYDDSDTPNAVYLIDAHNGVVLRTLINGYDFAQSTFADGLLYTANDTGVYAWGP